MVYSCTALKNPLNRIPPPQEHTFELGERAAVLHQVDQPAIIPHLAEVEGKKFPYEVRAGLAAAARWPSC